MSTPGAAVGHRLIQILEDDLPGPGLLNLCHRHPAGQVISPSGDHFPQFGFGYRSAVWAWQRDIRAIGNTFHHTRFDAEVGVFRYHAKVFQDFFDIQLGNGNAYYIPFIVQYRPPAITRLQRRIDLDLREVVTDACLRADDAPGNFNTHADFTSKRIPGDIDVLKQFGSCIA